MLGVSAGLVGLAAASVPGWPSAFTSHLTWMECGDNCTYAPHPWTWHFNGTAEHVSHWFFGDTRLRHEMRNAGGTYDWFEGPGGSVEDCKSAPTTYPIQTDWAWLNYSTTKEAAGTVACPDDESKQCRKFEGPWPEQVTADARLWLRKDAAGAWSPVSLAMTAASFPFTIYKNYTSWEWKPPPAALFVKPKGCPAVSPASSGTRVGVGRYRRE